MTNMIYEGTTGVNEDLPPENISNLSGPQAAKNSDDWLAELPFFTITISNAALTKIICDTIIICQHYKYYPCTSTTYASILSRF